MKDWRKALVLPGSTILNAIQVIDKAGLQIALVANNQYELLGAITDGDIRRAILKGHSLEDTVETVMVKNPVTALATESNQEILQKMRRKKLHQIPVLDDQKRIIRVELLDELISPSTRENWVVFMAGGLGTRLRPLTEDCPKPLLRVGGKPILETNLLNFIDQGFYKFYFSVNYKAEMFKEYFGDGSKWGVEIRYLHEESPLGTAGAVSLLPEKPSHPFFVMNGDLLTKVSFQQLLEFHVSQKSQGTMCVREYDFQVPYGVVKMNREKITGIDEKPMQKFFVNAGIYVLDPICYDLIPKNQHLDMPKLFDKMLENQQKTLAFPIREYWMDVGHMGDFERANGEFDSIFKITDEGQ